jgi:multidrug efflux pump subunit AcrA (membrane-fusion protein)
VVAFEQPDELVKVGMTGEIKIILSEKTDCLLVPSSAIREGDNGSYVDVVVNGTLTPVSVVTGVEENGMVEIVSGNLNEGDLVKVPSA